ncbi:MAG TPA: carboxypeptidase-like regulatory domain-containing protein [Hyphomicrobiales bacterium]|nr:carboxypeptidase-like regulatory domain-containing protein [Hyphomicrobiales bacterium]
MKKLLYPLTATVSLLASAIALAQVPGPVERVLPDGYITGRVTSSNGPEAGVWVIAETHETNTPFIKIVVTDDDGRFALPQLPEFTYNVWVRGYGLLDSEKIEGRPGDTDLELTAEIAPTPQEAAQVYPGDYWLSLLEPPSADKFPGTGPFAAGGNGFLPNNMQIQADWMHAFKKDCNFCHQLGNHLTRTLDHMSQFNFETHEEAWIYRTSLGTRGGAMQGAFLAFGMDGMAKVMADWTRSVAAGDVPEMPPRPQGIERDVVVTLWDVGGPQDFMHDVISTDKNNPTVNANGPLYAVSSGHGTIEVVDPITNDNYKYVIPTREDPRVVATRFPAPGNPSNFWGMDWLWGPENPADPHNPMLDPQGRVWNTSKIRNDEPAWCNDPNSDNKFVQYYPLRRSSRQASVFDPQTQQFELIDTCYSTHHLSFATDADNTVYFNELLGPIFGWINTRVWDETHDEVAAQGWCPQIVDTNGDGKITKPWNPDGAENPDPNLDTEVSYNLYNVVPDPTNPNVVWGAYEGRNGRERGAIVRLDRGDNPPETCITEVYQVPEGTLNPRGMDLASDGTPWAAMAATSQWATLDRSKCDRLNGPGTDISAVCPNAWTVYQTPGPKFKNSDYPTDFHYFGWVDQHDVIGLGKDTPILTGSNSDSLIALNPETGEWTYMRVPYPMGFYQRGLDGRIDDPNAGWKGRALYSNYGTHLVWHSEGGKGFVGKVVKIQIRPDPLDH